jgi:anti-sigma-K factor RskA
MNHVNKDYEAVARWLDGEAVELTAEQRALGAEIAAGEAAVGVALDAPVPPGALHRAAARLAGARPAGRRSAVVWRWVGAAAAAAAAVVFLALPPRTPTTHTRGETAEAPVALALADELDAEVAALGQEIADYRVALIMSEDWPFRVKVLGVQDRIEDLLDEGEGLADPAEPERWKGSF